MTSIDHLRTLAGYAEAVRLGVSPSFAHRCATMTPDELEAFADRDLFELREHLAWHDHQHLHVFKCQCLDTGASSLAGIEYRRDLAECIRCQLPEQPPLFEVGS